VQFSIAMVIIGLAGVLIYSAKAGSHKQALPGFEHLQGWHKLFGLAAFLVAIVIMLNPELLALGLVGDAAFFDLLVLALSVQIRGIMVGVWHWLCAAISTAVTRTLWRMHRDWLMVVVELGQLGRASATLLKVLSAAIRRRDHTFA
jgi:hypothetical protein